MRIIILLSLLACVGCSYRPDGTYFSKGIAQYKGEGTIRDVSQKAILFGSRGYVIEFEKFGLDHEFNKELRLTYLPTLSGRNVEICLAFEDYPIGDSFDDRFRKGLDAAVTVCLTDSAGNIVTKFSSKVGDLTWSSPVHGYNGCWLYSQAGSFFTPQPRETYILNVSYSSDATLRGKRGSLYLYSGCGGS